MEFDFSTEELLLASELSKRTRELMAMQEPRGLSDSESTAWRRQNQTAILGQAWSELIHVATAIRAIKAG